MTNFIRAANPIWWIPDLTGFPLNDEYYAFFLTNDLPYVPQPVYQDPNGINPWPYIIEFQPSGTLPNNLYFDETKTYRIEIRHGNSSNDPLIWLIENFTPGNNVSPGDTSLMQSDNMITNPQFADINFVTPYTFTQANPGNYTIDIGAGWQLKLVGMGTVILTRSPLAGASNTTGNPPYFLDINSSGSWSSVKLVQRFNNNGAIFAGGAIAVAFTARATGTPQLVSVQYFPSSGSVQPNIFSGSIAVGSFIAYSGIITVDPSTNVDLNGSAYVDIIFNLPATGEIALTNVQIVGQSVPVTSGTVAPLFQQETYERIVDHEFHVYKNSLLTQTKNSILTGWNFSLNPWQFITAVTTTVANQTQYIADQTILHQETASALQSGKGGGGINFGLQLFAINGVNANRFAIIQYIDSSTMLPHFGQILSALVRSAIFTTHNTLTKMKVRLIYRTAGDAVPTISATEPINGWDSNGDVTFAAGWTAISPVNDNAYTLTAIMQNNFPELAYDRFQLPSAVSSNPYLGIVVYITTPLNNTLGSEDSISFERISLTPNDYAIDDASETWDESLRKCQFYYQKSYPVDVLPGTVTFNGSSVVQCPLFFGANSELYRKGFSFDFKQVGRAANAPVFYSPNNGAAGFVYMYIHAPGGGTIGATNQPISGWAAQSVTTQNYSLQSNNPALVTSTAAANDHEGILNYQYTVDERLGI